MSAMEDEIHIVEETNNDTLIIVEFESNNDESVEGYED